MAMALAFVTSYIKVFSLPYGGSVTLFSMLFICLIGYWYGPRAGILTGLSYSILQFLQEPYILTPLQVCLDCFLGFGAVRFFQKPEKRSGDWVSGGSLCQRAVSYHRRLSVLDGLYAGQFSQSFYEGLSDRIQLFLYRTGSGGYGDCSFRSGGEKGYGAGENTGMLIKYMPYSGR